MLRDNVVILIEHRHPQQITKRSPHSPNQIKTNDEATIEWLNFKCKLVGVKPLVVP